MPVPQDHIRNWNRGLKEVYMKLEGPPIEINTPLHQGPLPMSEGLKNAMREIDIRNLVDQMPKHYLQDKAFREAMKNTDGLPDDKKQDYLRLLHQQFVRLGLEGEKDQPDKQQRPASYKELAQKRREQLQKNREE